jgi:hypothetical protein
MAKNLKTVAAFVGGSPFTEPQVRWWLFNANENGLNESGAVIRIGRRIYLDVDAFDRWIDSQNAKAAA